MGIEGSLAEDLAKLTRFSEEFFENCISVWRVLGNQGGQVEIDDLTEPKKKVAGVEKCGLQIAGLQFGEAPNEQQAYGVVRLHINAGLRK